MRDCKKTQENKGTFIQRQEYTVNDRTYVVDGKHVKLNPSDREMSIAVLLSEKYGKKVELIPQVMYPQGIQTPDYLIDKKRFDLKSQRTGFLETIVFLKNEEIVKVLSRN